MSDYFDDADDAEDREDRLRSEAEELRADNSREIRGEKIQTLKDEVDERSAEWKVDFRISAGGIDMFEGERRVATIFDPLDAQRLLEILRTYAHMSKIASNSLAIVGDLHRYLNGPQAREAVKFVTDSNYVLGVLKKGRPAATPKEALDKPESKA